MLGKFTNKKKRSVNILIKGWFGHNNLGDDLLLRNALLNIPKEWNIYVDSPLSLNRFKEYREFTQISGWKSCFQRKYDICIYSGGGLFPSVKFGIRAFFSILLSTSRCKKLVMSGIGIVPKLDKVSTFLFRTLMKRFDYISVRDKVSYNYLQGNAFYCGDLIFGYSGQKERKYFTEPSKIALICLADIFNNDHFHISNKENRYKSFIETINIILDKLAEFNYKIYFISFHLDIDDRLIHDIVTNKKRSNYGILRCGENFALTDIDSIFSSADFALSMRFHSKVLCIKNSLPFVGICYDYKSESLLEECEIPEIGIRFGISKEAYFGVELDLCQSSLLEKIDYAFKHQEVLIKRMEKHTMIFQEMVKKNNNIIYYEL